MIEESYIEIEAFYVVDLYEELWMKTGESKLRALESGKHIAENVGVGIRIRHRHQQPFAACNRGSGLGAGGQSHLWRRRPHLRPAAGRAAESQEHGRDEG